jgi:hypothetical protein
LASGKEVEAGIVDAIAMETDEVQTTKGPFADQIEVLPMASK